MFRVFLRGLYLSIFGAVSDTTFQAQKEGFLDGNHRFQDWLESEGIDSSDQENLPAGDNPESPLPSLEWDEIPSSTDLRKMRMDRLAEFLRDHGTPEEEIPGVRTNLLKAALAKAEQLRTARED